MMELPQEELPASGRDHRIKTALIIDGEAVVVDRVALVKSAVARAAAAPTIFPSDLPDAPRETGNGKAAAAFGRRGADRAGTRRRRQPDLLFQGPAGAIRGAPSPSVMSGVSLFLRDTRGSIPEGRKMAALGVFVLCLLVPAAVVIAQSPLNAVASSVTAPAGLTLEGLVIEDVGARISARNGGDVLEVEGVLRNVSDAASLLPPLRIALADDEGTTTLRPVSTGERILAAGATLRFHSAVAVPSGTEGDVSVAFAADNR